MQVLTQLDMNKNQIINVIVHKVSTDPVASANNEGMFIYNTTEDKLKYFNGAEWVTLGTGSGGGVKIDTILNDSSTNNNAAGSKAVVDYVATMLANIDTVINQIKAVSTNSVLIVNNNGNISGIKIDSEVTESSNNLVTSKAVYNAIKNITGTITKTSYTCPAITGVDNKCVWEIELEHTVPATVQVYNSANEMVIAKIKDSSTKITITFNGLSKINANQFKAIIIY